MKSLLIVAAVLGIVALAANARQVSSDPPRAAVNVLQRPVQLAKRCSSGTCGTPRAIQTQAAVQPRVQAPVVQTARAATVDPVSRVGAVNLTTDLPLQRTAQAQSRCGSGGCSSGSCGSGGCGGGRGLLGRIFRR